MKNFAKYIYYKTQVVEEKSIRYAWYLIDKERREGVHFHGVKYEEPHRIISDGNKHGFSAHGIESHRKTKQYDFQTPVKDCIVTCGDCYCDGSSLQASERLGFINPEDRNDEDYIWFVLHEYFPAWIEERSPE